MKRVISISAALAAACMLLAVPASAASFDAKVTPLTTTPLPQFPGHEVEMIVVEYPPGGYDPVHRHDADAFVYVLEGSIVMGVKGGKEVTLKPGEIFHEGLNDIHTVGRNASTTQPAKFVVFLIKKQGAPLLQLVK